MTIKKTINVVRQTVMRGLTKNVGSNSQDGYQAGLAKEDIKRVLISRPNHRLGNLLLITPLVAEVAETFPGCQIDLFVKGGLGPVVFKNYAYVHTVVALPKKPMKDLLQYFKVWTLIKTRRYDMVINVIKNSSSGRLSAKFSNARFKFFGDDDIDYHSTAQDCQHMAKFPVCNFRAYIGKLGLQPANNLIHSLDLRLTDDEISNGRAILKNLIGNEKKTICLYTFATGDKCYSKAWWETFFDRLSSEYADYNFIEMLPIENVSQLSFKIKTYYSKDIREMGSFLRNCAVWIGGDSGIMHLASASGVATVGLFSVTNAALYEPYGNGSIGINTSTSSIDEWIKKIGNVLGKG